jgi:hypothetical protein
MSISRHIEALRHRIDDPGYQQRCKATLDSDGALVLAGFFAAESIAAVVDEFDGRSDEAFYAASTHNVYLTPNDPTLAEDHAFNRQVASSKGLLADDQIDDDSPLKEIYRDAAFQRFLCAVLGIDAIYPYADDLSSVNVHFAAAGQELGWHFDNSSFAVTMLLRAPEAGGRFDYVPGARNADGADHVSDEERSGFATVAAVLDADTEHGATTRTLRFEPGDLVLFRGRDALHRVTPTEGSVTRLLAVLAYNDEPDIGLSDSALATFYGRSTR